MSAAAKGVLLTGATGLLGGQLLARLLIAPDEIPVRILVRGSFERARALLENVADEAGVVARERLWKRVSLVSGDVTQPDLGLSTATRDELASTTSHIINSAVVTDFAQTLEAARLANVSSLEHLLELARRCPGLEAFAHLSTTGVAGKRIGTVLESELEHDAGWANYYEQSKYEAERVARAAMSSLPVAVYRTSSLVGDSRSGRVRQYNYMHRAFYLVKHGLVLALPGDPASPIDLIPIDYAADAIHHLIVRRFVSGTTYHIAAGRGTLTLQGLVRHLRDHFRARGALARPDEPDVPIVAPEVFEQMLADNVKSGSSRAVTAMRPMRYYLVQLALPKIFDVTHAERDLDGSGIVAPPTASYLDKVLDYCLQTGFGKKAAA